MAELHVDQLPVRILAALSERMHRLKDGSQRDPWVTYRREGCDFEIDARNLEIRKAASEKRPM